MGARLIKFSGRGLGRVFTNLTGGEKTMFWLGVFCLFYLWYRIIAEKQIAGRVEHHDYDEDKRKHSG